METKITRFQALLEQDVAHEAACLVQIYGPTIGKKFILAGEETTIGRGEGCEIVLELDNVSRRHCTVIHKREGTSLKDLGSTNGTYLNNKEVREETPLRTGDLIKVGSSIFKFLEGGELGSIEAQYHEEIYRLTIIDGLTQVHNKRYLLEFLDREMARCNRHERPLSVLLFDLDHFKNVNDTYGHLAGDYVLREMAAALKPRIRREECFARYGGEEFVILLANTSAAAAAELAEKIRLAVETHTFVYEDKRLHVTTSIGVAELRSDVDSATTLFKLADKALYAAKHAGRNRVVVSS